jgi:hypothetical protein
LSLKAFNSLHGRLHLPEPPGSSCAWNVTFFGNTGVLFGVALELLEFIFESISPATTVSDNAVADIGLHLNIRSFTKAPNGPQLDLNLGIIKVWPQDFNASRL